ncbi:MAG: hypothetical protein ACRBK7_31280 [Acidimicrobiales bacterium]
MADDDQRDPVDQLIDMFVYAPVGMLYEYQEVMPKLVRRGKSQVQIAKVIGQLAFNRNRSDAIGQIAGGLTSVVARQITEFGEAIGLAPPKPSESGSGTSTPPPPSAGDDVVLAPPPPSEADRAAVEAGESQTETDDSEAEPPSLPIARYDELTAKEIISLLADLEPDQLDRIRAHEEGNRARKTVLGKLDRLAD